MNKIEFINIESDENKSEALEIIIKSLRKNGDFGVYGDLSIDIKEILKENYMSVTINEKTYDISIAPDSQFGHDFSFKIDIKSLKITELVVGEVIPPPKN